MGHPRGYEGFRAALCPPRSHPQSLAGAGALAHLPSDVQIWGRGFSLINRLQLIVLSAKGVQKEEQMRGGDELNPLQ